MPTILKDSRVFKLFTGQLLAQVCDRMTTLGLVWYLGTHFGTAAIAWFLALSGLPHLLLARISSRLIRRWGLVQTCYAMDFLRGILFLVAAALWNYLGAGQGSTLFVVVFLSNVAAAFFNPAIMSLPVRLFDEASVQPVTSLLTACFSVALVLGPLASLPIVNWLGISGVFAITAAAYFASGFCTLSVNKDLRTEQPSEKLMAGQTAAIARTALEFLKQEQIILILLVTFFCVNVFLAPLQLSMPDFARTRFGGEMRALVLQEGALGLGMLLGGLCLSFYRITWDRNRALTVLLWIMFLCLLVFAGSTRVWGALGVLFLFGLALAILNVIALEYFQMTPRPDEVPMIMSWMNLISVATLPISMSLCGLLLPRLGLGTLLIASLVLFFVVNLAASVLLSKRGVAYAA